MNSPDALQEEPSAGPAFADVAVPLALDAPLTYAVPQSLRARAKPGMRVLAPVQRKVLTGYIVGVAESSPLDNVRAIIDLPDETPVFSPELLDLCKWISEYYCCSWGEALHCALPAGLKTRTRVRYTLVPDMLGGGRFSDRQRKVVAELHRRGPLTEGQLAKSVGGGALSNTLQSLVRRGVLIGESVVESGVSVRTETYVRLLEDAIPDQEALSVLQRRAPRQAAVYLDLLYGEPVRPAGALYDKHKVNSTVLKALEDKGLVRREEHEYYRAPEVDASNRDALRHPLNDEQQAAYDLITQAVEAGTFQTFLLKGVTGSGKTEVYLQAVERALELGRDAIILVPEISLTPQTVGRFKARFESGPDAPGIAVLHSGLGDGERYDEWRRAQRGEVRIVVGARSAIFAPLPNLGLIVVDEEHDHSYKQTETPRYHARDAAIMRATMNKAVCVVGSATPSIESYRNTETGKSSLLVLRKRATDARLPEVELVDMRVEAREAGASVFLSRKLEQEIRARAECGDQVLLLLNRRGFSPYVLCPMCGWVAECADCQVSLTYHASGGHLSCHYCNARRPVPQTCGECGFQSLLFLGAGTQKVEDVLTRSFPHLRIERMDADTTAGKGGHARILGRFAAREIDILVGTQMIAKGHDYPNVTLVGVLNADTGLAMPDFRSAENVFQLLTQVSGRAGRGKRPGKVVVQTYRPRHYAVRLAAEHDYDAFYQEEIEQRRAAGYPPFRRMANIMVESEDALEAEKASAFIHRLIREDRERLAYAGVEILGPTPALVRRVRKKYRWNVGLLSKSGKRLNVLARAVREAFQKAPGRSGVQIKIDLDPHGIF
jgi:primosomal protein N' (replication factor Y)